MSSNGSGLMKSSTGSMVWWDLKTVPPPQNHQFMDHLLASHRAMRTGLFSLSPPVKLRAHGTEPLADSAHDCIVKNKLFLQQSISPGSEQGSTRCWRAMVVDMLLWAIDHTPDQGDVIIISKVFDRSMADVIHQLHIRNYNIMVTTAFPPKDMTSLRLGAPPLNCKLLQQIFPNCDSLPSSMDVNTMDIMSTIDEPLMTSENHKEASNGATNSQPEERESLSQVNMFCTQMIQNCKKLVEEILQKGITEFLECDLYAFYRIRHGEKLNYKKAGFEKLEAFLEVAVPGVNFRSVLVGTKPWIISSSPGRGPRIPLPLETEERTPALNMIEEMRVRQSMLLSDVAKSKTATRIIHYGPLTMGEVRNWLQELVACGRADTGINISLLGQDFEEHRGKKLNHKSLHCPTLMLLLSKFKDLIRLERKGSMVLLFPSRENYLNCRESVLPKAKVVSTPMKIVAACKPECAQISTLTLEKIIAPSADTIKIANPALPATSEMAACKPECAQISTLTLEKAIAPSADTIKIANPALPATSEMAACKPECAQISTLTLEKAIAPSADTIKIADPALPATSEIKIEQSDRKIHLPNVDTAEPTFSTQLPSFGAAKAHQASGGEDVEQGTNVDAASRQKFDFYSLKVVQEREAIKRTFQSVNKRLQEAFKKRKLAEQEQGLSNQVNNTAM